MPYIFRRAHSGRSLPVVAGRSRTNTDSWASGDRRRRLDRIILPADHFEESGMHKIFGSLRHASATTIVILFKAVFTAIDFIQVSRGFSVVVPRSKAAEVLVAAQVWISKNIPCTPTSKN